MRPEGTRNIVKIHVEITEEEMNSFLQYRQEKENRRGDKERLKDLAKKVLWAIDMTDPDLGVTVIDQDHAEELLEMAAEYAK